MCSCFCSNGPGGEALEITARSPFVLLISPVKFSWLVLFLAQVLPKLALMTTFFFCPMSLQFWNTVSENVPLLCRLYDLCLTGHVSLCLYHYSILGVVVALLGFIPVPVFVFTLVTVVLLRGIECPGGP